MHIPAIRGAAQLATALGRTQAGAARLLCWPSLL